MTTKVAIAAAGITLLALMLVAVHHTHHARTHTPAAHPAGSPPSPAAPASAASEALLPFTPSQITQAAQLAATFTATYASHRYDETPTAYLTRLQPMISPQLRPVIERAATDPDTLTQRRRLHQITTAQAHPEAIRALGPTSITFLVTAIEHVATAHANRTDTTHYALTLTKSSYDDSGDGDGWRVYAIELASTGNTGELTATPDPAS